MRYVNCRSFINRFYNRLEIKGRKTFLKSKPVEIGIEPTNKCNSKCIMCNRRYSRVDEDFYSGFMGWDILKKNRNLIKYSERVCFGGFGEPFLHPDYLEMGKFIKSCGPDIYCFTNGELLHDKTLHELVEISFDEICVSMGGGDRKTHKYVRRIDNFNKIVANLMHLNDIKRVKGVEKPLISFNIVAMNTVLKNLDKVLELAITLGVRSVAMPNLVVQGHEMEKESPWINIEESQEIFRKVGQAAKKRNIIFGFPDLTEKKGDCHQFLSSMQITWDGKVLSCPFERFILGDLKKSSLADIWNSEPYRLLRDKYYSEGISAVCPNCSCWDNRRETFLNPEENTRRRAIEVKNPSAWPVAFGHN